MALILNGKLFDPSSKAIDEHVAARAHYTECVTEVRKKYGKYGYVRVTRRKPIKRNPTGLTELVPMIIFPAKVHCNVQFATTAKQEDKDKYGGMETWAYSMNIPRKSDNEYTPSPASIKFVTQERTLLLDRDMELIYYLLFKSPHVFYPEAVNKYGKRQGGVLVVDDKDAREKIIAEGRKDAAKLNTAIYGDASSPLYDEATLRATAAAWGLEDALSEKITDDELRNKLYADVSNKQAFKEKNGQGKGIDDFLTFISFEELIRARALILDAISSGVVKYDIPKFSYVYASSGTPVVIVPEKHRPRKFDYLCDILLAKTNDAGWEKFRKEVITPVMIDEKDFRWCKWLAKIEGLPLASKSEAAIREALRERYA